jgi:hypothetical protein
MANKYAANWLTSQQQQHRTNNIASSFQDDVRRDSKKDKRYKKYENFSANGVNIQLTPLGPQYIVSSNGGITSGCIVGSPQIILSNRNPVIVTSNNGMSQIIINPNQQINFN